MNRIKNRFSSEVNLTSWANLDVGTINFKGGIFALKKIKNRLFVFCPKAIYELVKNKKGFKKIKVDLGGKS